MVPESARHAHALGDLGRQQVAVLESALARAALDVEVGPARLLLEDGPAEPFLLRGGERGGRRRSGDDNRADKLPELGEVHGPKVGTANAHDKQVWAKRAAAGPQTTVSTPSAARLTFRSAAICDIFTSLRG